MLQQINTEWNDDLYVTAALTCDRCFLMVVLYMNWNKCTVDVVSVPRSPSPKMEDNSLVFKKMVLDILRT